MSSRDEYLGKFKAKPLKGTRESRRKEADRQAIERGEDEGMIVGPE